MIKEHYLFITVIASFSLLLTGLLTIGSVNTTESTGYFVRDTMFCEPMTCIERGLEPSGRFYCDKDKCYRDCYQDGVLIEMATFCEKALVSIN